MSRPYRFYVQRAHLLTHFGYGNSIATVNHTTIEQPTDIDWRISFANHTLNRHGTRRIKRFLAKLERHDQRNGYVDVQDSRIGKDKRYLHEKPHKYR